MNHEIYFEIWLNMFTYFISIYLASPTYFLWSFSCRISWIEMEIGVIDVALLSLIDNFC
uniref:Uncharacterized protein n=1 Tax=Nelumbo nucifera TaxID=4432 RepID=A0A822ZUZ4_NELNU|nr:TPA_asm: hypothetical protein HUJ06_016623 [Nelumbo nucifera]